MILIGLFSFLFSGADIQMDENRHANVVAQMQTNSSHETIQKNGVAALYLLRYRTENDTQIDDLFAKYRHQFIWDRHNFPPEIRAKYINDYNQINSLSCGRTAQNCLKTVAKNPKKYAQAIETNKIILKNVHHLAQYDGYVFDFRLPENSKQNPLEYQLPEYAPLLDAQSEIALNWQQGKRKTAWQLVCQRAKIGQSLLNSSGNTLMNFVMGRALLSQSVDYASIFLYEQPDFAANFPENCATWLQANPQKNAQSYCSALKGEWFIHHQVNQKTLAKERLINPNQQDQITAHYLYENGCSENTKSAFTQDKPLQEYDLKKDFSYYFSCTTNAKGCVLNEIAMPNFGVYVQQTQDLQMQLNAFQAALKLAKLPENQRAENVNAILKQYSSPYRALRFNATTHHIEWDAYAKMNRTRNHLPVTAWTTP